MFCPPSGAKKKYQLMDYIQDKLLYKLYLPASEHVILTILLPVTFLLTLMLLVILNSFKKGKQ